MVNPLNSQFKMAILAGVETSVRLHVRRGDELNARDSNGMTPLMLAASKNKAAVCLLLLSSGADSALLDPEGNDALTLARIARAADALSVLEWFSYEGDDTSIGTTYVAKTQGAVSDLGEAIRRSDLSDWEAEEDVIRPKHDRALWAAPHRMHATISEHIPIDMSDDWREVEALLPARAVDVPNIGRSPIVEDAHLVESPPRDRELRFACQRASTYKSGLGAADREILRSDKRDEADSDREAIDEVIAQLRGSGASVIDGRTSGGEIVVKLVWNGPPTRVLIHTLLDAGFTPYPGMEYRR